MSQRCSHANHPIYTSELWVICELHWALPCTMKQRAKLVTLLCDTFPRQLLANIENLQAGAMAASVGACRALDEPLMRLTSLTPELTTLSIAYTSEEVSDRLLLHVSRECPELTSLDLTFATACGDVGIQAIAESLSGPKLKTLSLRIPGYGLTTSCVKAALEHCVSLQRLDIRETVLEDAAGVSAARSAPDLRSFAAGYGISDETAFAISEHCRSFQELICGNSHVTARGILAIAKKCQHFNSLDVAWSDDVNGKEFVRLVECRINFFSLDLTGVRYLESSTIQALIAQSPALTFLSISHLNHQIDDDILLAVSRCHNLKDFRMRYAGASATSTGLAAIAQGAPNLTSVDLFGASGITDDGIKAIAYHASKNLTSINVGATEGLITNVSLFFLARHAKRLKFLGVDRIETLISDVTLLMLPYDCVVVGVNKARLMRIAEQKNKK